MNPDEIQPDMFPGQGNALSPRLQWRKDNEIIVCPMEADEPGDPDIYACGFECDFDCPEYGGVNMKEMAFGATEDEAEINFCEKHNIKHYNAL